MSHRRYPLLNQPARLHKMLCLQILLFAALLSASPLQASEAVIVEVYQDCRLTDTNVVIDEQALAAHDGAEVKARVAAASREPQLAVARIVEVLKEFGIDDVAVSQQGLAGCEPETSGKFVEAVGTYCGPELRYAEVFVDRESYVADSDPDTTFEEFLKDAVKRLRDEGVFDRPVVSIENAPDCEESS